MMFDAVFPSPRRVSMRAVVFSLVLFLLIVLMWLLVPHLAHAQAVAAGGPDVPDPSGMLTAIVGLVATVFPGVARYLPTVLSVAAMLGGICVLVTAYLPPPTSESPKVWLYCYAVVNFFAGNFGHARNAAVAGMLPAVRDAAITAAKLTAADPAQATVAGLTTMVKPVIGAGTSV